MVPLGFLLQLSGYYESRQDYSLGFEDIYKRKYDKRTCNGWVERCAHSKKAGCLVKKLISELPCTKMK